MNWVRSRAQRITAAWAEQKIAREIMVFLHSHGVGTVRAVRIYKTYGADGVQVMTENPYRLARDIDLKRHQFSADCTISMFEFDFRQGHQSKIVSRDLHRQTESQTG
jgi:ATP-dependent exoDNAse (exonuclease V) alpha subunit